MIIPVGSSVKGLAKLGIQKTEQWTEGKYLGDNKVEFRTGAVMALDERKIKPYKKISSTEESKFVDDEWEKLKQNIAESVSKFFPNLKIDVDEKEHIIYTMNEYVSICPAIVERETISCFMEIPTWEISVLVDIPATQWEPADGDVVAVNNSPNCFAASRLFLDTIWNCTMTDYWIAKNDDHWGSICDSQELPF